MKILFLFMFLILFEGSTSLSLAQNNAPVNTKNPKAHDFHKKLKQRMVQIQVDLKAGKISEAQAKARRNNLRAVHQQEVQFRRQNGGDDLSESQKNQLNNSLDKSAQ